MTPLDPPKNLLGLVHPEDKRKRAQAKGKKLKSRGTAYQPYQLNRKYQPIRTAAIATPSMARCR